MSVEQSAGALNVIGEVAAHKLAELLDQKVAPLRPRYLRPPAAAEFIGLDETTLSNFRSAKIGPKFRRLGKRIVYDVSALIEFVESHPLGNASGRLDGGSV